MGQADSENGYFASTYEPILKLSAAADWKRRSVYRLLGRDELVTGGSTRAGIVVGVPFGDDTILAVS